MRASRALRSARVRGPLLPSCTCPSRRLRSRPAGRRPAGPGSAGGRRRRPAWPRSSACADRSRALVWRSLASMPPSTWASRWRVAVSSARTSAYGRRPPMASAGCGLQVVGQGGAQLLGGGGQHLLLGGEAVVQLLQGRLVLGVQALEPAGEHALGVGDPGQVGLGALDRRGPGRRIGEDHLPSAGGMVGGGQAAASRPWSPSTWRAPTPWSRRRPGGRRSCPARPAAAARSRPRWPGPASPPPAPRCGWTGRPEASATGRLRLVLGVGPDRPHGVGPADPRGAGDEAGHVRDEQPGLGEAPVGALQGGGVAEGVDVAPGTP